ncbi:hypothetical protein LZ838_06120 [Pseudomonas sp. AA27]|uniref:hypothetical protein n=1 Tax=Pseudomonas sp. AA27 TaxID=2908652 RepID=UPI001F37EE05|nr:hypothetical protein [Pseudomonas sp. AA27]MCF1486931.1 hypothetical protein [Pseudomonas sp. AA27]
MNTWALRFTGAGLLIVFGMAVGTWVTTRHFRPLLDNQQDLTTQCAAALDSLAGLVQEQGEAIGDLTLAANERQAKAEHAVGEATASAQVDFAAANRLQHERTGGDQCAAAASIIDKELAL